MRGDEEGGSGGRLKDGPWTTEALLWCTRYPRLVFLTSYAAVIRGARHLVRAAEGDETGNFTLVLGARLVHVDHPCDMLSVVEPGEEIVADFGRFALAMRLGDDGRVRYSATAGGVEGPVVDDDERACWGLLARLGDGRAPRACFFCRWSDVEPSTGWGNLGCAVAHRDEYDAIATSPDPRRRKWAAWGVLERVDEWHSCDRFEVRPIGYGYRGRPAPE